MPDSQTNIQIQAPKLPEQSINSQMQNMMPAISGEGYKLIDRLVDPNALYLDKLTTFLYCAHLVKSNTFDPESPYPGYRLMKVGGTNWKPNMNLLGYTTVSSEILMALAEDGSVTRFPKDFMLAFFCARQTMSIIAMMCANRKEWEFTNYMLIDSFGHTLWKALVAVLSRSRPEEGRRELMSMLVHPNLWFTQGEANGTTPKSKWFDM